MRRVAVELGLGEAEAREDFFDPVIDRIGVLVLDLSSWSSSYRRPARSRSSSSSASAISWAASSSSCWRSSSDARPDLTTSISVWPGGKSGLLPQQADPDPGPDEQVAVIGLIAAGQDLHERGLAGAVGPDQSDPLAGADLERQVHEDRIAAVLPAKPLCGDEDHECTRILHGCFD